MSLLYALSTPLPFENSPSVLDMSAAPVDFTWTFLKMVFAMVAVIALAIVLIRFVLPRLAVGRSRGIHTDIRLTDRLALDAKKALYVVEVEGKRLLIGASENHLSLISELENLENKDAT